MVKGLNVVFKQLLYFLKIVRKKSALIYPFLVGLASSPLFLYTLPHIWKGVKCVCFKFPAASFYHSITVAPKGGKQRVERAYKPKEGFWWTTLVFLP